MVGVRDDIVVSLDYTLRLDDGDVVDSSAGSEPLEFIQGRGMIVAGLEKALYGMNVGDEKDVVVLPEDGYGELDSELLEALPRSAFPPSMEIEEGMGPRLTDPSGETVIAYVDTVDEQEVIVDLNHPLAGEILHFSVRIAGLREATPDELANGLAGCGCSCGESRCGDGCAGEGACCEGQCG